MKKISYFVAFIVVILSLSLCLSGCGAESDSSAEEEDTASVTSPFQIEDIDWAVEEGIDEGERCPLLHYTNNSEYTVVEFELQFKEKDGITEEEKGKYCNDIKKLLSIDESDPDDAEDLEELKTDDIELYAKSEQIVKAGETVSGIHCRYYKGNYSVKDMNHYALVAPDIATIRYIDDEKVFTVYYDYSAQNYSIDNKTEPAYYWTEFGLEKAIPKPKADYVKDGGWDDSTCFIFDVCGWTPEDYNSYVKQCKEYGFTVDIDECEGYFTADSANGYSIDLFYDEEDFIMSGTVSREEEKE